MAKLLKKILILGPAWPYRGGLATYNERLTEEFLNEGVGCELLTFTTQYPNLLFPGKTQYTEEKNTQLTPKRILSSINPLTWFSTASYINRQQPDLVITRFWIPFMGPCLGTVIRLLNKNIKVICLLDNVIPHEKRIGDKILTRYFLAPIQSFIAMSLSVQKDLLKFKPDSNCILSPHPVFDNFGEKVDKLQAKQSLGLEPTTSYVLFFGFIRKYKGLDLALKALSEWKLKLPNTKLLIAGEFYDDEAYYKNLAVELKLEDQIVWHTNFINDSQVKLYFSAASLLLQPYYSATQSGVTQIAYQFELPMIVTNVGGLAELVHHKKTGYLVEVNEQSIAHYVIEFFKKDLHHWKESMIEAKEFFSWKSLTKNIVDLYNQIK